MFCLKPQKSTAHPRPPGKVFSVWMESRLWPAGRKEKGWRRMKARWIEMEWISKRRRRKGVLRILPLEEMVACLGAVIVAVGVVGVVIIVNFWSALRDASYALRVPFHREKAGFQRRSAEQIREEHSRRKAAWRRERLSLDDVRSIVHVTWRTYTATVPPRGETRRRPCVVGGNDHQT